MHTTATNQLGLAPRRRPRQLVSGCIVALALVTVTACGGDDGDESQQGVGASTEEAASSELPAPGLVAPEDAVALADAGVTVIDVRTPEEFAEGHIDGATLIDFYEADFAQQIGELDPDGEYLLYCRSGNRSGQAAALMDELGFETVFDLDGGVLAYDAAGMPLER